MASANTVVAGIMRTDPELRLTPSGSHELSFSIPVKQGYGEHQKPDAWYRIVVYGKRAESLAKVLRKGVYVSACGPLEATAWIDKQGKPQPGLRVVVPDVAIDFPPKDGQQASFDEPVF
jgi:single-strand DNA-binding protein